MRGTVAFLRGFLADRRQQAMLGLGFSQGIPYLLVYATQSAWLTEANVALGTLGILSELTLAYRLKFLWAPFLERYDTPILGALLGRRRGWMVASQLGVIAGLVGIAVGNPATQLWWTIVVSVALGFCGATQDVVIDGWRIASVPTERQALMTSIAETGYRVGILVSSAGALILSDHIGWHGSYFVMAAMMLPGMAAALYAPEPEAAALPAPEIGSPAETRAALVRLGEQDGRLAWVARRILWFVEFLERLGVPERPMLAVVATFLTILAPLIELVRRLRPMAIAILVMVAGFRMPGYISNAMAIPLFKHLHYSNTDIGTVTKLVGFWIAIAGVFAAGIVVTRIGIMASLVIGTIAGSASHLALAYLAAYGAGGHDYWTFAIAVGIDGFAASFAQIVLITYMSSIASNAFAGSQFGMLTSLVALPGSVLTVGSGFAAGHLGFPLFFTMTALIGLPIAILTIWVWHVEGARGLSAAHRAPSADAGLTAKKAPASGAR